MDCSHIQLCVHDETRSRDKSCPYDQLSIYDAALSQNHRSIDLQQLQQLFQLAAFWAADRSIADLEIAIAHSKPVVTVWDGDRLIGFARATSDGVYRATIWDVIIHPDYQGAGLGRKMVETVLMHPHVNRVERVYLMTTHQQKFYERIGFEENQTTTMVLFNQPVSQDHLASQEQLVVAKELSQS